MKGPAAARPAVNRRLDTCRAGDVVLVGSVEGEPSRVDRLAAVGILPGVELRVQQIRPVVVVECDETVLALEREIAAGVVVADVGAALAEAAE
jgi:Fe2+ transport system protein FeoA